MFKLAIVIPAYKGRFLRETLRSVSNQTCKDFTLYIGDDASPEDLNSIISSFKESVRIVYKRFTENIGKKNLVAQWERCIDLVSDEEWIWLFSDDDIMSEKCVEGFYELVRQFTSEHIKKKVLRFNLDIADNGLNLIKRYVTPAEFTEEYFLQNYFIDHTFKNKAVEFIFSKKTYVETGKFVDFPLAWGSDTATMLKFGRTAGYLTINKGLVLWRASEFNISAGGTLNISYQKQQADYQFHKWIYDFIGIYKGTKFHEKLIFRILSSQLPLPSFNSIKKMDIGKGKLFFKIILWIFFLRIKRLLRYSQIKHKVKQHIG